MVKFALLALVPLFFALGAACSNEPRHDPPFVPPTSIPTRMVPTTRPAVLATAIRPTPTSAADRVKVLTETGKPTTTFTARQRPTSIPPLTNCTGWYDDVKGVAFQITDEGLIQLDVKFTFEVIDGRRGLIPNLFFIYPGDYVYVEREGVETFLFRIDAIRTGQGVHITLGGEGRCGGRVS